LNIVVGTMVVAGAGSGTSVKHPEEAMGRRRSIATLVIATAAVFFLVHAVYPVEGNGALVAATTTDAVSGSVVGQDDPQPSGPRAPPTRL
jgi:hypothetical protein